MNSSNTKLVSGFFMVAFLFVLQSCGVAENDVSNNNDRGADSPISGDEMRIMEEINSAKGALSTIIPVDNALQQQNTPQAPDNPIFVFKEINKDDRDAIERVARTFLLTLKESNWKKQYDKLLHEVTKAKMTQEEYTTFWSTMFPFPNPVDIATVSRIDLIETFSVPGISQPVKDVAVIQADFFTSQRLPYLDSKVRYFYFAKSQDGYWKLLWYN